MLGCEGWTKLRTFLLYMVLFNIIQRALKSSSSVERFFKNLMFPFTAESKSVRQLAISIGRLQKLLLSLSLTALIENRNAKRLKWLFFLQEHSVSLLCDHSLNSVTTICPRGFGFHVIRRYRSKTVRASNLGTPRPW